MGCRALRELPPNPSFSVYPDKEAPELPSPMKHLSLPWTGLLVCSGVEGPDSSEAALHWASRGDRGRVLCPLGPSLQDTGSGDSAGRGAVGQEEPLLPGLALPQSVLSPPFPRTLFCPGHPPSQGLTCRCQGSCWGQVPRQQIPVPSLLCRDLVAQLPGLGVGRAARGNGASPGGVGTRAGIPSALTWRPTAVRHPAICWAVTGNCSSIAVRHQGRVPWVPIPSLGAQGVGAALMPFLACLGWLQAAVVRQRGVVVPTGRHQQGQRVPGSHWVQEGLASLTCPPLSSLPLQPQPIEGCRGQC